MIADIAASAPGLGFEIIPPESRTMELIERGEADILITIDTHITLDSPHVRLFEDEHAVICWSGSPHSAGIDAAAFSSAGHVISHFGPARTQAFSEIFFEREGISRRIEVRVSSFTMLSQAVIGTHRLATLQRGYAEYYARFLPITVLPTPFETPKLREVALRHSTRDKDEGIKWLVVLISARSGALQPVGAKRRLIVAIASADSCYRVK